MVRLRDRLRAVRLHANHPAQAMPSMSVCPATESHSPAPVRPVMPFVVKVQLMSAAIAALLLGPVLLDGVKPTCCWLHGW